MVFFILVASPKCLEMVGICSCIGQATGAVDPEEVEEEHLGPQELMEPARWAPQPVFFSFPQKPLLGTDKDGQSLGRGGEL